MTSDGRALHDILAREIATWRPRDDLPADDPLAIQLLGRPEYLPLLQTKQWYSQSGRRRRSRRTLGLAPSGDWVVDNRNQGRASAVYGPREKCFGQAPFALHPLVRARAQYPALADVIWDEEAVERIGADYLRRWSEVVTQLDAEGAGAQEVGEDQTQLLRQVEGMGVANALGWLGLPSTLDALLTGLSARPALVRREAVHGLMLARDGTHNRHILPLVTDSSAAVRAAVAWYLGSSTDPWALAPLLALLDDDADEVVVAAADALVALGDPAAREPLIAVVQERLAQMAPDGPDEVIGQRSPESAPFAGLIAVLLALQTFWDSAQTALVLRAARHPLAAVRTAAIEVLMTVRPREALPDVRTLLWDGEAEVRTWAARAVAAYGDDTEVSRMAHLAIEAPYYYTDTRSGTYEHEAVAMVQALADLATVGSHAAADTLAELGRTYPELQKVIDQVQQQRAWEASVKLPSENEVAGG